MMYLAETKMIDLIKQQFLYKVKANLGFFFSLLAVQSFALLLSVNGIMGMGTGGPYLSINVNAYSNDLIIIFTMVWAFTIAVTLTTKEYRNYDFTFVSNRLTSNLSNILYLGSLALFSSVTAVLTGILLRVILFFSKSDTILSEYYFYISPYELILSIFVITLYILLLSSIGYLAGTIVQLYKPLSVILPVITIGLLIVEGRRLGKISAYEFFVQEPSLFLFTIKTLLVSSILFGCVYLLSNRMEVRK